MNPQESIDLLLKAYDHGRLGHALLLTSPAESTEVFQQALLPLAQALMCGHRATGERACGKCPSCRLLTNHFPPENHPDAIWIKAQGQVGYTVDQIREVHDRFSLRISLAANRVAWLQGAELLGSGGGAAANALLKILEEPRPNTFLILTASQAESLLPTLRSRCQAFRIQMPEAPKNEDNLSGWEELLAWLTRGAPSGIAFSTPADQEAFWQERSEALSELEKLLIQGWKRLHQEWSAWDREAGLRILDFFTRLENLIFRVRHFANPHLQWLNLRTDAKLGNLWKP